MMAAGGSNIGMRKDNEDRYEIKTLTLQDNTVLQMLVIADGMGGHEHGQLASRVAVEQFAKLSADALEQGFTLEHMQKLFERANEKIYAWQELLQDGIIGTTLTAVVVQQDQLYLGHVGDSRCYVYRDDELIQLSMDHTYYAELMRLGKLALAAEEKQKSKLLKALGAEATVEGQFLTQQLRQNDLLVLCTDGLYNAISIEEVSEILQDILHDRYDLTYAVDILLNKALEQGARDNLTLILYQHGKTEI